MRVEACSYVYFSEANGEGVLNHGNHILHNDFLINIQIHIFFWVGGGGGELGCITSTYVVVMLVLPWIARLYKGFPVILSSFAHQKVPMGKR
jgi:hypothetical protein